MFMAGDIEAHSHLHHSAILKRQNAGDMSRDMNRDFLAVLRFAGDKTLIARRNGKACDLGDRAEQIDEIGDVIGPMSSIGPPPTS